MRKNILLAAFGLFLGTATFATAQTNEANMNCCKSKTECKTKKAGNTEKADATSAVISANSSLSNSSENCPMGCC